MGKGSAERINHETNHIRENCGIASTIQACRTEGFSKRSSWRWKGLCKIVKLSEDFTAEVATLNQATILEPVELDILETLEEEKKAMKASEISSLVDVTYQLVGKRTTKLQQMGLVNKSEIDGANKSQISEKARGLYFKPV